MDKQNSVGEISMEDLKATIKLMRDEGVLHLKDQFRGIEILMSAQAMMPKTTDQLKTGTGPKGSLTDDQMLFAATEGYPDES